MSKGELAPRFGDLISYLASLGGSGAVSLRLVADWFLRDARRPRALHRMTPSERIESDDVHAWLLWLATVRGALVGVMVGVAVLVLDTFQQ
jgi:hypothetical protein